MSKLQVLEIPHPILRETAAHVEVVTPEIQELLSDMLETMYATHGVGLAGNQVGKLLRVVVIDCGEEEPDPIKMVNPDIAVAGLSLLGTGIGSLAGIMVSNKLTNYRIEQLEKKVDKHNGLVERMIKVEAKVEALEESNE